LGPAGTVEYQTLTAVDKTVGIFEVNCRSPASEVELRVVKGIDMILPVGMISLLESMKETDFVHHVSRFVVGLHVTLGSAGSSQYPPVLVAGQPLANVPA
jgi:hypothetical protein